MMTSLFASRIVARSLQTSARVSKDQVGLYPNTQGYKKYQELQNHFSRKDGRLIWQKMGTRDTLLYNFTMAIFFLGWIPLGITVYKLSFPQAKKDDE